MRESVDGGRAETAAKRISREPDRHRRAAAALIVVARRRTARRDSDRVPRSSHRAVPKRSKRISGDLWDSGRTESPQSCHDHVWRTAADIATTRVVESPHVRLRRHWQSMESRDVLRDGPARKRRLARPMDRRPAHGRQTHARAGSRAATFVRPAAAGRERAPLHHRARVHTTRRSTACARIDVELAPGWTDFSKRVRYQTFDVTRLLKRGENVIGRAAR